MTSATEIRPFRIAGPQADLADLRDRLSRTRWTNELPPVADAPRRPGPVPPGREYGVPLAYVRSDPRAHGGDPASRTRSPTRPPASSTR